MDNKERIKNLKPGKYKEIFGVEKHVFDRLFRLLETADVFQRKNTAGRKSRLSVLDKLVITLMYCREYRTYRHIAFDYGVGKTHDFKLFKDEFIGIDQLIQILADSGYQGIIELHANSKTPIKKRKNQELTPEEKAYNLELSRLRILIENVNRRIKRFKIMCDRYRNKRKRHGLRMTILFGLHNMDLWMD